MRAVMGMWVALIALMSASGSAWAARTVAVLPLHKGAAEAAYDGLGTALSGMLITDLSRVEGLELVERQRLKDLLSELALADTGFLDPDTAQRVGRGVGAQILVVGSFSVIKDRLQMDTRMVAAESGKVLKAADAAGPIEDFVAVEKAVVEALLTDGLKVQLSMGVRRKLLIETPTESLEALASYGQGVEKTDRGELDEAKAAFSRAVALDPEFAEAQRALADLRAKVEAAQQRESERYQEIRDAAVRAALAQLPSELGRGKRFRDTPESMIDLGIRWALLRRERQHCALYDEMRHFLERTRDDDVGNWISRHVPPATPRGTSDRDAVPYNMKRWRAAEALYDARGRALGLVGPGTPYGTRPGEVIRPAERLLGGRRSLLTSGNLRPEKFDDNPAWLVEQCLAPPLREAAWVELTTLATRIGIADEPISRTFGEGPSPIDLGTVMRLHRAYLRAGAQGADAEVLAMTEAVLARFPEGAPGRREVLGRVNEILSAGEAYERRKAARLQLSEAALRGIAKAIADQAPGPLTLDDPLCRTMVADQASYAAKALERVATAHETRRDYAVDQLGAVVTPIVHAGCTQGASPRGFEGVLTYLRDAVALRHPATLDDEGCTERTTRLAQDLTPERVRWAQADTAQQARMATQLLARLHQARTLRCLLVP